MDNITIDIKKVTYNGLETFYHAFYKEDGKVTVFSVMTDKKGK